MTIEPDDEVIEKNDSLKYSLFLNSEKIYDKKTYDKTCISEIIATTSSHCLGNHKNNWYNAVTIKELIN